MKRIQNYPVSVKSIDRSSISVTIKKEVSATVPWVSHSSELLFWRVLCWRTDKSELGCEI